MADSTSERDTGETRVSCEDYGFLQDVLKQMRTTDDQITNALNTTVPTDSFARTVNATAQCKSLFSQLVASQAQRQRIIKHCINEVSAVVAIAKEQKVNAPDDLEIMKKMRQEQFKLRQIQSELHVEEIVNSRTMKVLYERCRLHYIPEEGYASMPPR